MMEKSGYPTSSNGIFGQDKVTGTTSQAMYSIAIKRTAVSIAMLFASCACSAAATKPLVLQEPVLGLRYEIAKNKFDTLPKSDLANCETFQDDSDSSATWYVYGKFKDASGRTYYVSGGYETTHNPTRNEDRYETTNFGAVFFIDGSKCVYLDEARQTFVDRVFNDEMSPHVLQGLATDIATRLARAFGGTERLKVELRNQRIDLTDLPPELRAAFKSYIAPGTAR